MGLGRRVWGLGTKGQRGLWADQSFGPEAVRELGEGAADDCAADPGKTAKRAGRTRRGRGIVFLLALTPYAILLAKPSPQKVSFGRDVAPILKTHCISCHSGAGSAGGLDLLTAKALMKGGGSGPSVVAGKPDSSLLLQRILGKGGLPQMPKGLPALTAEETQTIRDWIAQGAQLDTIVPRHWAYVAPVRPKLPDLNSSWVRNPIDAFVLAKLKEAGLRPSPEASKETLIRRASLDLTGLPPTLKEIDDFLADKRPDAYARLVDRLMTSPQYGVRQAREWLDLSRYADTDGFEKDLNRTAWKYRDWVIDAFNKNLSYKDFVIDQIAGDMLPNATLDDKIATGFERNTMMNLEGGVDQAEAHFEVIRDRVDTAATVFLGSTLQCAKCHDHKYDPFTQRDYYKMAAFFSSSKIHAYGPKDVGEEKWFEGEIPAPSPEQSADTVRLQEEIKRLDATYNRVEPDQYSAWQKDAAQPVSFVTPTPSAATSKSGSSLTIQKDASILAGGNRAETDVYTITLPAASTPTQVLRLEALTDDSLPSHGPGRADNGNFVISGLRVLSDSVPYSIASTVADYTQNDFDPSTLTLPKTDNGWAVATQTGHDHELRIGLAQAIPAGKPITVVIEQLYRVSTTHLLGRFRISEVTGSGVAGTIPGSMQRLIQKSDRSAGEEQSVQNTYLQTDPSRLGIRTALGQSRMDLAKLQTQIPTALTLEEEPSKDLPSAYIRHRGEYLTPTEKVTAGTPAILPPLGAGRPDRMALAKWLVSPYNPLTARVEVNRMWERYFGRGIVETSEDFGTRGSRPTHPELLDWLACEFMRNGWDMKAMNRMIVMSATYRQSSAATPDRMAKDPENLLLARGPRFRMEAEMIHDEALASAGLISLKMGGPSVMPYQPNGIWDSPYSGQQWMPSKGVDRYRRGIYTFIKRTAPYPAFLTFDSTSREFCTVRRIRTNSPLQALELMNDKLMIEAAKGLATEMMSGAKTDDQRLALGFRLCTARYPKPDEEARLKSLLVKLKTRYDKNPKSAAALGKTPEDAAYAMVGNVLLNLDETITKG